MSAMRRFCDWLRYGGEPDWLRSVLPPIPVPANTPVPLTLTQPPKVIVWRTEPGQWAWIIGRRVGRNGYVRPAAGPGGVAPSQPAALALGLAALDTTRSH